MIQLYSEKEYSTLLQTLLSFRLTNFKNWIIGLFVLIKERTYNTGHSSSGAITPYHHLFNSRLSLLKHNLSVFLLIFVTTTSSLFSNEVRNPFPTSGNYKTHIKPTSYTATELNAHATAFYDLWKARYLRTDCGDYYVWSSQDEVITFSEAHGYGMMLAAYFAGHDANAKSIFDGLYNYFRKNPSNTSPDLMDWTQLTCNDPPSSGDNSASDGDIDIAYALLLAHVQWGSTGEIDLNDYIGGQVVSLGVEKPIDLSYNLKLTDPFSMGFTARYFRSDLGSFNENRAINSFAFDIGAYYQSQNNDEVIFRHGAVIANLGPKVKYNENQIPNFIPTTLRLGTGAQFNFSDQQSLELVLEFNKLLVPSYNDEDIGFVSGIFRSLSDAQLQGITWALGTEYKFKSNFSFRSGYYRESINQGSVQFFSLGTGIEISGLHLDFSYLINTSSIQNQLQNSLRLSLGIPLNFEGNTSEEAPEEEATEISGSGN